MPFPRPWRRLMYDLRTFGDSSAAGKHAVGTAEMGEMLLSRQKDGGKMAPAVGSWFRPFFEMAVFSDEHRKSGKFKSKDGEFTCKIEISPYFTNKNGDFPKKKAGIKGSTGPACSISSQPWSSNSVTTIQRYMNSLNFNHETQVSYSKTPYMLVISLSSTNWGPTFFPNA